MLKWPIGGYGRARFPDRAGMMARAGFTLVEVLVAFTILALVMVVVQRGVLTAVGGANRVNTRMEAEMVARTLMTAPLADALQTGTESSGQLNGYEWTIRLEPVSLPFATSVTADGKSPEWVPLRMIIGVSDRRRGQVKIVTETIRLVKASSE